jgi:hypothetical protein
MANQTFLGKLISKRFPNLHLDLNLNTENGKKSAGNYQLSLDTLHNVRQLNFQAENTYKVKNLLNHAPHMTSLKKFSYSESEGIVDDLLASKLSS